MEEKSDSSQPANQSAPTPDSPASPEKKDNAQVINEAANDIVEKVKKFNVMSMVAVGLVIVFAFFMLFNGTNLTWWIMLPIAGGAGFLLYRQHEDTHGFEKKVCFYAFIVLCVLFLLRDIGMSSKLSHVANFADAVKTNLEKLKNPTK